MSITMNPIRSGQRAMSLAAVALALTLVATACGDSSNSDAAGSNSSGSDNVIKLGEEPLAPPVEDIQVNPSDAVVTDVAFTDFEGNPRNLSEYAGTPLVVNFFAAWCPTCIAEMPDFEIVHQQLGSSVNIVGLSIDVAAADGLALIDLTGVTYDTGWDQTSEAFAVFGGFSMPTTVFIDASGNIVETYSGGLSAASLLDKISQIT